MRPRTNNNKRRTGRAVAPRRAFPSRMRSAPQQRTRTIPAPINIASNIRSTQPKTVSHQSATDRLFTITLPAKTPRGTVFYDQAITVADMPRLRQQGGVFQKCRWINLTFEVQTQTPTTSSGGYVVAFASDPNLEIGSGLVALNAITTLQGAQTSKIWQSVVLKAPVTNLTLFVAPGQDLRFYSPGRFIGIVDGELNVDVSLTILVKWTVTLSSPARVQLAQSIPQPTLTGSFLYTGQEMVRWENWNPSDNTISPALDSSEATDMRRAFSGLLPMSAYNDTVYYRLNNMVPVLTTDPISPLAMAMFMGLKANGDKLEGRLYRKPTSSEILYSSNANYLVLSQGERITPINPREFSGNTSGAFFVNVRGSNSAPGLSQVYKTLQMVPMKPSSDPSEQPVTDLSLLSEELNGLYI